jgi:hypothetical protein
MAIITKTIGTTGRDYSTLAAWAASLPANLVTDGNSYVGQCYNDAEFFASTALLTLSGHTTDATHTITLTTGPGQSFRDNASPVLRYDASKGVAIRSDGNSSGQSPVRVDDNYVTLSNLQISGTVWNAAALRQNNASGTFDCNNCVLSWNGTHYSTQGTVAGGAGGTYRNCVIINQGGVASSSTVLDGMLNISGGANFYFCTLVAPSDATNKPSYGIRSGYGSPILQNCAIFGATAAYFHAGGSGAPVFTTSLTDVTGTTGLTGSTTYANQFVNITTAAGDYRQKTGASLQGAGTADATNGATDILGTARPQGGSWDVGCHEIVVAAAGITGTLTATQAAQTLAATGGVTVRGTLGVAQASQTLVAAGGVVARGTLSVPQAAQTLVAAGGPVARGIFGATQSVQTLTAAGTVISGITGTLAATQASQTLAAAGGVTARGTLAATQDAQTLAAAGGSVARGTLAATQAAQTLTAAGTVISSLTATLAATQAPQTLAAAAASTTGATLARTQAANTLAAAGTVSGAATVILNFPDSPSLGMQYAGPNGLTWEWDGHKWTGITPAATPVPLPVELGGTETINFPVPGLPFSPTGVVPLAHGASPLTASTWATYDNVGLYSEGGTAGPPYLEMGSCGSTVSAPAATPSGQLLGAMFFDGYGGGAWNGTSRAQLLVRASELWTGTAQGTRYEFVTTAGGTTSTGVKMTLDGGGNLGVAGGLTLGTPVSVANGGTGLASGTSGGIPYYNSTTTLASSALLTANALIKGGGAGLAPVASTATVDGSGNMTVANGLSVAGAPLVANSVQAPYINATQNLSCTVDAFVGNTLNVGTGVGVGGAVIEIGAARTAAGAALVDFHTVSGGATDYEFRIVRASGANGAVDLTNTGTGILTITNSSGVVFTGSISTTGRQCRAGTAGPARGNNFNIDWVPGAQLWVDTSNLGTIAFTSDYRIKENVEPLGSMWDKVKALRPVVYNIKDTDDGLFRRDPTERWGFIAHELQETLIENAASGQKDEANVIQSLDLPVLLAATTKALQEAMARIEALEAARS